jgi:hypothetical protein
MDGTGDDSDFSSFGVGNNRYDGRSSHPRHRSCSDVDGQIIFKKNKMNEELKKRIGTFLWGIGGFSAVAVCAYLVNISDIREIDLYKVVTIFVVAVAGYVVNQVTKYINVGE